MSKEVKLSKEVQNNVNIFDQSLTTIESLLKPLSQQTKKSMKQMDAEKRAKLSICCAYTVNTLFYMYLKTQGIDPSTHPCRKEIQRIQTYMQKLREKQAKIEAMKKENSKQEDADGRSMKVDAVVAHRLINNILTTSDNNNNNTEESAKKRKRIEETLPKKKKSKK
ncbi:exosome complex protein LRP1 [Acrasis kona]|uniref:Nuclear nucleic acid-binding protein C1D n=1 Tax=Acrasis kona TaxID=1008807 RepID=A0AAW2ZMP8_9EUKA